MEGFPSNVKEQTGKNCLDYAVANTLDLKTPINVKGNDLSRGAQYIIHHFGGERKCHSVSCNGWPDTLSYFKEHKDNIVAGIARTRIGTVKTRSRRVGERFNHFVALRAHPDTRELYVLDSFDGTVQQASEREGPCVAYFFMTGPKPPPEVIEISD